MCIAFVFRMKCLAAFVNVFGVEHYVCYRLIIDYCLVMYLCVTAGFSYLYMMGLKFNAYY